MSTPNTRPRSTVRVKGPNNSLPSINDPTMMIPQLKVWQTVLNNSLANASPLPPPRNFTATSQRGGILLQWASEKGADGYQIVKSSTGDFSFGVVTIPLPGGSQNAFFDSLSGSGAGVAVKQFYKIRATSGTLANPQSVLGKLSGIANNTSIDSADVATASTTGRAAFGGDDSGRVNRGLKVL